MAELLLTKRDVEKEERKDRDMEKLGVARTKEIRYGSDPKRTGDDLHTEGCLEAEEFLHDKRIFGTDKEKAAWLFRLYDTCMKKATFIDAVMSETHWQHYDAALFWELMEKMKEECGL
jgi:hypothetical protein